MERNILLPWGEMNIPCRVYEPDFSDVDQVVIGVHGFGGNKDSSVLRAVAEEMYFYRTATIVFDFPGHGESAASSLELNLRNCKGCLMAVAELAQELFPHVEKFGLFASSFGAYVGLYALDDLMENLGRMKIVLRAPAVRMNKTFLKLARMDEAQLLKKGRVICGYERKMEIPYSFYEELLKTNVVADYDLPMMILEAELDDLVDAEDVEFFRLLNGKSCLVTIPGAGHRFDHEGEMDMIVDLTRDWFLCEEVLLCEYT